MSSPHSESELAHGISPPCPDEGLIVQELFQELQGHWVNNVHAVLGSLSGHSFAWSWEWALRVSTISFSLVLQFGNKIVVDGLSVIFPAPGKGFANAVHSTLPYRSVVQFEMLEQQLLSHLPLLAAKHTRAAEMAALVALRRMGCRHRSRACHVVSWLYPFFVKIEAAHSSKTCLSCMPCCLAELWCVR